MNEIGEDISALDFDSQYKREILVNIKSVILSAEICKVRMNKTITPEHAKELISDIDGVYGEFAELWRMRNYEDGLKTFLGVLTARRAELERFL